MRRLTLWAIQQPRRVLHKHRSISIPPPAPGSSASSSRTQSKILRQLDRWILRSPKFFKPSLTSLRNAPASYIMSFAILHEITAVVPLFGLATAFHYYRWLPPYFAEGKWVIEGVEKFGRYFRRKGWIQETDEAEIERETRAGKARIFENDGTSPVWIGSEEAGRWLVEIATAWAMVKGLLPLRIALSVWWAPGFARMTLIPLTNMMKAVFGIVKR